MSSFVLAPRLIIGAVYKQLNEQMKVIACNNIFLNKNSSKKVENL